MPVKTDVLLSVLLASLAPISVHAADQPSFHFNETPGPNSVGLKVVEQYDYSRSYWPLTDNLGNPYIGERARPLQTLIWYPAQKSSTKPMNFGDYGKLISTETSFGKPLPAAEVEQQINGWTLKPQMPLRAIRDAEMKPGHFPVVIYAPSFSNTSWENADLCEYLASYGYVVIASPDMGSTTRSMTGDVAGVNAQARDISFLIGFAETLPDVNMSEIAVAGYSWGGISNLFAATRDNRIDALVALDGSMRYFPGLVEQAGDVHPGQMNLPMLFFTEHEITLEDAAQEFTSKGEIGPSVLNEWTHGDLITAHMLGMTHQEFSSRGQRYEDVWRASHEAQNSDYTREDVIAGYGWVARYTLNFLDAYLNHNSDAMAFLKRTPTENGVPSHWMSVEFRAAKGLPGTLDSFRAELGRRGFDDAPGVYAEMQKEDHNFKLEQQEVDSWAHNLLSESHLPQAFALFRLNLQNYPESSGVYDSLGDAYTKSGQKQLAIDNYKKAIEKSPNNNHAKQRLKEIESSTTTSK